MMMRLLMEAFAHIVGTSIARGANVSIRSPYQPEELGILS
jgi:hypothetical protein